MTNRRNETHAGQQYLGRIVHGSCVGALADDSFPKVDLVHTSPPYNIDKQYKDYADKLHVADYLKFVSKVASLISRRMRTGGSLFWQTGYTQASPTSDEINPIDVLTFPLFKEHGFYLRDRIIWRYYGGMSFKSKFKNQHETILWYVKGDPENSTDQPFIDIDAVREKSRELDPRNNLLGRNPGNVWEVDRVAHGSIEQTSHIAVFPEEITERIIRACSRPGDIVLDPFLGSGTVAKVAKSLGRDYIGIELSRGYYDEAIQRLGYQQSGEVDTVLSELLKKYLLKAGCRASKKDCIFYLRQLREIKPNKVELRISDWCRAFTGMECIAKSEKPGLWRMGEEFIKEITSLASCSALGNIALAYLGSYKLARHFNGLRLALIAYGLQQQVEPLLMNERKTDGHLEKIVEAEPSSYEVERGGNTILLKEPERRVKNGLSRRKQILPQREPALFQY